MYAHIPEQQCIGQTLPPVPVGIDMIHSSPLPSGAMPNGTWLQVGKYQVVIHNFIAQGGFAHVYLARIEGKTGYVVLKRIAVPDDERLKTVEKEIEFMRRLGDHKYIVRYYESRIDSLPIGGYEALILMEYCPGGGVIDLMNRRLQQRLTEPEILKIFSNVCEALAYMHYCQPPVLHRDLKIENILILSQDQYKLCDFGSACLSKGSYVPTTLQEIQKVEDDIQRHTTLQYRAPEMIDIHQQEPINEKADIWALGVLLYKLCYYTTPFEEEGQLATLNARYSIPQTPFFSNGLRQLIIAMLQKNQHQRPNIYQVIKAVSDMMHVDCPIRNIYQENRPTSHHHSPERKNNNVIESPPASSPDTTRRVQPTSPSYVSPSTTSPTCTSDSCDSDHTKVSRTNDSKQQSPTAKKNGGSDHEMGSHSSSNDSTSAPFTESHAIGTPSPPPLQQQHRHTDSTSSAPGRISASLQQHNSSGGNSSKSMTNMPSTKSTKSIRDFMEKKKAAYTNVSLTSSPATSPPPSSSTSPISPVPTISSSSSSSSGTPVKVPYRPKLPPKPIRFRTKPSDTDDDDNTDTSNSHHLPSLTEFKEKFPSLEELDNLL